MSNVQVRSTFFQRSSQLSRNHGRRPCSMFKTMSNVQVRSTFSNVQVIDDFDPNIQCSSQFSRNDGRRRCPMFKSGQHFSNVQVNFLEIMDGDHVQCSRRCPMFKYKSTFSNVQVFDYFVHIQCSSRSEHETLIENPFSTEHETLIENPFSTGRILKRST